MAHLWAVWSARATHATTLTMQPILALVINDVVGCNFNDLIDRIRHEHWIKVSNHWTLPSWFLLWLVLRHLYTLTAFACFINGLIAQLAILGPKFRASNIRACLTLRAMSILVVSLPWTAQFFQFTLLYGLIEVVPSRLSATWLIFGRSFSKIRVHGVQVLEIFDVHEIIWQMALGLIAWDLSGLLLHQMMLMTQALHTVVVVLIDAIDILTYLLNLWNSIVLAWNYHFLILQIKGSV